MKVSVKRLNDVYTAKIVELKKEGLAKVNHKPPIGDEDLKRLYQSGAFSTDHPKTLLNKVYVLNYVVFLLSWTPESTPVEEISLSGFQGCVGEKVRC